MNQTPDKTVNVEIYDPERDYKISMDCYFWQVEKVIKNFKEVTKSAGLREPEVEIQKYKILKRKIIFSRGKFNPKVR